MKSYPQKTILDRTVEIFSRFRLLNSETCGIGIFFILCFIGVFLGDGKQVALDVFFAGGAICLYGITLLRGVRIKPMPNFLYWSWLCLLLYVAIRTLFSDSVGASLYIFLRTVVGFLIFWLFISISSVKTIAVFEKALLLFVILCCGISVFYWLFSLTSGDGLLMSLVYPNYGHNHLSILLVLFFPIFSNSLFARNRWVQLVAIVSYAITILLTFSRAALIISGICLVFVGIQQRKNPSNLTRGSFLLGMLFGGVFVAMSLSRQLLGVSFVEKTPLLLQKYIFKPTLQEEGRFEYWKQAIVAISERPLFGSGPGTFDLLSRRLQNESRQFSWFAHNAPLQVLAETGFVGGFLFLVLIIICIKQIDKPLLSPLFVGVCLVGLLSLVDFVWDFYVVQIIVAAIFGLLVGKNNQNKANTNVPLTIVFFLFVLLGFYFSGLGSFVAKQTLNNNELAFYLAPYNKKTTILYVNTAVSKNANSPPFFLLPAALFRGDSDVLSVLANSDIKKKSTLLARIFYLDPYRLELGKKYILLLEQEEKQEELVSALAIYLTKKYRIVANDLDIYTLTSVLSLPENRVYIHAFLEPIDNLELSKAFYFAGFSYLPTNKTTTRRFWQTALDFSPEWSYFYLELAGLERELGNVQNAKDIMSTCTENIYAREYCVVLWGESPPVGSFYRDIQEAKP